MSRSNDILTIVILQNCITNPDLQNMKQKLFSRESFTEYLDKNYNVHLPMSDSFFPP